MLTIHLNSPLPLAEQIRLGIRQSIASGELAPGDSLPSVRQLAGDLGVNFNTVARAYRDLEQEGLVISRRGRGTMVASAGAKEAPPSPDLERHLVEGVGRLLADARLAGLSPEWMEQIFQTEMAKL
ncbi:GntR family transcriptional regulator, partial [Candidatus Sumerlaeota bacterium]|nr:GntR family transcriptional regulator [Candidatus Sumerlaeota bacterium]